MAGRSPRQDGGPRTDQSRLPLRPQALRRGQYAGAAAAAQKVIRLPVISSSSGQQGRVSPAEANELTRLRQAAPHAVVLDADGQMGRAYQARTTPHMYIIDQAGKPIYMGSIDSVPNADVADIPKATQYVRVALQEHAAGRPISQPVAFAPTVARSRFERNPAAHVRALRRRACPQTRKATIASAQQPVA